MAILNVKNFPQGLYDKLKERALADRRSVAQEVVYLLERAVMEAPPLSLLQLRGLGKDTWRGVDVARYVDEERGSWD